MKSRTGSDDSDFLDCWEAVDGKSGISPRGVPHKPLICANRRRAHPVMLRPPKQTRMALNRRAGRVMGRLLSGEKPPRLQ